MVCTACYPYTGTIFYPPVPRLSEIIRDRLTPPTPSVADIIYVNSPYGETHFCFNITEKGQMIVPDLYNRIFDYIKNTVNIRVSEDNSMKISVNIV